MSAERLRQAATVLRLTASDDTKDAPAKSAGQVDGEKNGKQSGVHSEHARNAADWSDRSGLHVGSGVLDRSGSDPQRQFADGAGRGLTERGPGTGPSASGPLGAVALAMADWLDEIGDAAEVYDGIDAIRPGKPTELWADTRRHAVAVADAILGSAS